MLSALLQLSLLAIAIPLALGLIFGLVIAAGRVLGAGITASIDLGFLTADLLSREAPRLLRRVWEIIEESEIATRLRRKYCFGPSSIELLLARLDAVEAAFAASRQKLADSRMENEGLRKDLACADREAASLRKKVEELRASAQRGDPLHRRVGLSDACPDWVLRAVRREYRRKLHPDGHPTAQKLEATRRYQDAESVFAEIFRARGLK